MNKENMNQQMRIIKEVFDEKRNIIDFAPPEMTDIENRSYDKKDIFITDTGELIDLEYQNKDFDEIELAKYVEIAEELFSKNKVPISIYVLCPKNIRITAPECTIKSDAVFNIKLASYGENPVYDILHHIKEKVDKKIRLNDEDIETLNMIPMIGPKEERTNLRIECFKLLNKGTK